MAMGRPHGKYILSPRCFHLRSRFILEKKPLSVSTSNATLPPTKGDATSNFNIYVLSRMAVLINMPSSGCPPMSDSAQRNEIPLPYFDIGSMEIGILPGSRDGSSLP
jgi:hypothetical protein